jgi:hypothetical protein
VDGDTVPVVEGGADGVADGAKLVEGTTDGTLLLPDEVAGAPVGGGETSSTTATAGRPVASHSSNTAVDLGDVDAIEIIISLTDDGASDTRGARTMMV